MVFNINIQHKPNLNIKHLTDFRIAADFGLRLSITVRPMLYTDQQRHNVNNKAETSKISIPVYEIFFNFRVGDFFSHVKNYDGKNNYVDNLRFNISYI